MCVDGLGEVAHGLVAQVGGVEDLVAAHVDDLALLVHDLVVLQDVLADLGVALLDGVLGPLDGLADHLGLDRHVVLEGLAHHPVHGARGEQAHEVVLERQVEAALAGVALTAGAASELVVDAAALMALGAEHVEPADLADAVALGLALRPVLGQELVVAGLALVGVGLEALGQDVAGRELLGVAAQQDVDATAGHVGGHGDGAQAPGLGHDLGLTEVQLGVQDLVVDALLGEVPGELLGLGHRDGADEHGLTGLVALGDVLDDGVELGVLGLVDEVTLVEAHHRPVGRDGDDLEVVGAGELGGLGLGRSGHAGELVVHAEVVLEGDRGEGLVLLLDLHALLGLDGLVEALGPAPALEDAAGELVDDPHLALLHDVVLVALEQLLGPQRGLQLVDQVLGDLVVHVVDAERLLDGLDALLGGRDGALLLVDVVVDLALEAPDDGGELVVDLRRVGHPARDDEGRAGLVDEDRVDLVDDAVVLTPLHLLGPAHGHVVAEVVEAELVVGAVGDVAGVLGPLVLGVVGPRDDQADRETEAAVHAAHPLRVSGGQVVVHGDDVDAVAGEGVEVDGQRGDEGLALTRLHLPHPAEVEGGPAHQLDVVVALADLAAGRLAHDGEGLDEQVVEILPVGQTGPELDGLGRQGLVGEGFGLRFERVDLGDQGLEGPDLLAFTGTEELVENAHGNVESTDAPDVPVSGRGPGREPLAPLRPGGRSPPRRGWRRWCRRRRPRRSARSGAR